MKQSRNVAIIGAGMAGLSAARALAAAGIAVTLFDKARRPGGRLATRQVDGFTFNHGCQFFTARDAGFAEAVQAFSAPWPGAGASRFAGVPDMAAIAAGLAQGLDLKPSAHVRRLEAGPEGWRLYFDFHAEGPFGAVILAIPAPQAALLLNDIAHHFAARLREVRLAPCWAVMLGFDGELTGPDTARREAGPISWMARENTRPGAAASPATYTLHGAPAWSAAHLEADAADIISALTAASGLDGKPVYAAAHRWRHALAQVPLGQDYLWDEQAGLGLCGDWCLGGRLEAAYLSGRALGIRLAA